MINTARYNYSAILKKILVLLPFFLKIFKMLILFVLYFKNYKMYMLSLNCKHAQYVNIYLPSNFNTFRLIYIKDHKRKRLSLNCKKKCAVCQDLHTIQFVSKSHFPCWSYCPFL